jgi:imidazolonepropionase-like amidohydrolase
MTQRATRWVLLTLGLLAASAPQAGSQTCETAPLRIRNTSVWTRDGVLAGRDVLFRAGRVAAIEPARGRRDDGVKTIDGRGHTLLPGLIDAHLHFVVPGGLPPGDGGAARTDAAALTGRQLLRSGVTAGRLHLASLDEASGLKARSLEPCAPLPRLQVGGPGISGAAARDFPNFQGARSVEDARAKVARAREAHLDWIAIHDADRFAPGVLPALADAARAAGIRLFAAATSPAEIAAALAIAPDTLDYVEQSGDPFPAAILDAIRSHRDLVLVPPVGIFHRTGEYLKRPDAIDEAANFEGFTASDRGFAVANARKALDGPDGARARRLVPVLPAKLRQLRGLGLPIALGSDTGSPLHFQGGAIWWELEGWRAFGATAHDALVAATDGGARVLRATDIGRLAPGTRADFVLYRGDVEQGPFDLARVLAVGKDGVLFVEDGRWIER